MGILMGILAGFGLAAALLVASGWMYEAYLGGRERARRAARLREWNAQEAPL